MPHPVLGVDHAYLLVDDLNASSEVYRKLGFTLSPRGLHSPQKGTANHTIIFADDYFELLGIVRETDQNLPQRQMLAQDGEGLKAIANRTESADAAKQALAELGLATGDVSAFSRPLPLPGGGEGLASFRTLSFEPDGVPLGHFFLCQHETPHLVWRKELQQHDNGAISIAGIVGIHEDPQATAETYARFYANGSVSAAEGGFSVKTGEKSAPLLFVNADTALALYPSVAPRENDNNRLLALRISVSDIERAKNVLADNDVAYSVTEAGNIVVAPGDASGTIIEFVV